MPHESELTQTAHGLQPAGDGWYVLNAAEAEWMSNERFGLGCRFEGTHPFQQLGINIRVLQPGQPACLYHRENMQENFLVLHGECSLLVEEEERALRQWDFVHCPAGTHHVFVGAGEGPCAILMVGARSEDAELFYPVSQLAAGHGASATESTANPAQAYEGTPPRETITSPWPLD